MELDNETIDFLIALEKQKIEMSYITISKLQSLQVNDVINFNSEALLSYPAFKTNVEAFKHILANQPNGLHLKEILKVLKELNMNTTESSAGGILRRYSREGRHFEALGGNRFRLKQKENS